MIGPQTSLYSQYLLRAPGGEVLPFANHPTLSGGLVSYWALDETSGVRYDSVVASANDLTDNNTVGSSPHGPSGTVASFIAANTEYLDIATPVIPSASDFTVAHWQFVASGETAAGMVSWKTNNAVQNDQHGLFFEPINGANHRLYNRRGFGSAVEVGDNRGHWIFVVYEYVHSTTTTRVKGIGVAANDNTWSAGSVAAVGNNNAFSFGGPDAAVYMNGQLARGGVWSRALTEQQHLDIFNSGNGKAYADLTTAEKVGLVSYWNLDEASGNRADSHGSNTLTDNNTVGSVTATPGAMHNAAASFVSGNNESLKKSGANLDLATSGYSVSFWASINPDGSLAGVFSLGVSWHLTMALLCYKDSNLMRFLAGNGAATVASPALAIPDSGWHHWLVTYDPADKKLRAWRDGSGGLASAALSGTLSAGTNVYVGSLLDAGFTLTGLVDEIGVWNLVLIDQEIADLASGLFYGSV